MKLIKAKLVLTKKEQDTVRESLEILSVIANAMQDDDIRIGCFEPDDLLYTIENLSDFISEVEVQKEKDKQ